MPPKGSHGSSTVSGGRVCCPWFHFLWYLVLWTGEGFLISGLHLAIVDVSIQAETWALLYLIIPVCVGTLQLFFAFFEVGCGPYCCRASHNRLTFIVWMPSGCAKNCAVGCCSWVLRFFDWVTCAFSCTPITPVVHALLKPSCHCMYSSGLPDR